MGVSAVIYFGSALACAAWAIMVLVVRRAAGWLPALACLVAAAWSAAVGLQPEQPLDGVAGILEVARNLAFLALLLAMLVYPGLAYLAGLPGGGPGALLLMQWQSLVQDYATRTGLFLVALSLFPLILTLATLRQTLNYGAEYESLLTNLALSIAAVLVLANVFPSFSFYALTSPEPVVLPSFLAALTTTGVGGPSEGHRHWRIGPGLLLRQGAAGRAAGELPGPYPRCGDRWPAIGDPCQGCGRGHWQDSAGRTR